MAFVDWPILVYSLSEGGGRLGSFTFEMRLCALYVVLFFLEAFGFQLAHHRDLKGMIKEFLLSPFREGHFLWLDCVLYYGTFGTRGTTNC